MSSQDVVCFDITPPQGTRLLFWWTRDGVDKCRLGEDGVLHLYNGATAEQALVLASRLISNAELRRVTADEAMREISL